MPAVAAAVHDHPALAGVVERHRRHRSAAGGRPVTGKDVDMPRPQTARAVIAETAGGARQHRGAAAQAGEGNILGTPRTGAGQGLLHIAGSGRDRRASRVALVLVVRAGWSEGRDSPLGSRRRDAERDYFRFLLHRISSAILAGSMRIRTSTRFPGHCHLNDSAVTAVVVPVPPVGVSSTAPSGDFPRASSPAGQTCPWCKSSGIGTSPWSHGGTR